MNSAWGRGLAMTRVDCIGAKQSRRKVGMGPFDVVLCHTPPFCIRMFPRDRAFEGSECNLLVSSGRMHRGRTFLLPQRECYSEKLHERPPAPSLRGSRPMIPEGNALTGVCVCMGRAKGGREGRRGSGCCCVMSFVRRDRASKGVDSRKFTQTGVIYRFRQFDPPTTTRSLPAW